MFAFRILSYCDSLSDIYKDSKLIFYGLWCVFVKNKPFLILRYTVMRRRIKIRSYCKATIWKPNTNLKFRFAFARYYLRISVYDLTTFYVRRRYPFTIAWHCAYFNVPSAYGSLFACGASLAWPVFFLRCETEGMKTLYRFGLTRSVPFAPNIFWLCKQCFRRYVRSTPRCVALRSSLFVPILYHAFLVCQYLFWKKLKKFVLFYQCDWTFPTARQNIPTDVCPARADARYSQYGLEL